MSDPRVEEIRGSFTRIGVATTKCATAQTSIAARLDALLDQITALPTSDEVQSLVDQGKLEVDKFEPVAASLEAMGNSITNPIPVPVPEPEPPVA